MMSEWKGFSDRELQNLRHSGQPAGRRPQQTGGRGVNVGGNRAPNSGTSAKINGSHVHNKPPTRRPGMMRGSEGRRHASASGESPPGDLSRGAFFQVPTPKPPQQPPRDESSRHRMSTDRTEPGNSARIQEGESGQALQSRHSRPPDRLESSSTNVQVGGSTGDQSGRESGSTGMVDETSRERSEADDTLTERPRMTLEELQRQQKDMEAENKKRKELIEKALQDRYRKSQVEAKTLETVKKELGKLDSQVSRDVAILRDKIEEADRQYTAARKRYEQAEMEFVSAKLELHRSSELKELMSEHLCTVIQQNEVRKAKKLAELLQALNVEGPNGSVVIPGLFQKTPTPGMDIWPKDGSPRPRPKAIADHGREVKAVGTTDQVTIVSQSSRDKESLTVRGDSDTHGGNKEQHKDASLEEKESPVTMQLVDYRDPTLENEQRSPRTAEVNVRDSRQPLGSSIVAGEFKPTLLPPAATGEKSLLKESGDTMSKSADTDLAAVVDSCEGKSCDKSCESHGETPNSRDLPAWSKPHGSPSCDSVRDDQGDLRIRKDGSE